MKRNAEKELHSWMKRQNRMPLIIRGARQVGKTYLIEKFGREHFDSLIGINLEKEPSLHRLFETNDVAHVVRELELFSGRKLKPGRSLLFLDEIQACPKALACLRYFHEDMPELHVAAAGSLLDFALREFQYSMPVGRIEYLYLHPLTFEEFLAATGDSQLVNYIRDYQVGDDFSPVADKKLREALRLYYFVGGMPSAASAYVERGDLLDVQRRLASITATLQDDFAKYGNRAQQRAMRNILRFVPRHTGRKVKFANIDREMRSAELRKALELLELSRVITMVRHSAANGIPLGAEASDKHFKTLLLDIGLCNNLCGLSLPDEAGLMTAVEGGLAEQFVGQQLLAGGPMFENRPLFYWHRERKNANAEVDYLLPLGEHIIPVEVRAGKSGSLNPSF